MRVQYVGNGIQKEFIIPYCSLNGVDVYCNDVLLKSSEYGVGKISLRFEHSITFKEPPASGDIITIWRSQ